MATSPYSHMETFVAFLMQFRPRSMLDIGLGNGKWGFLARDCLAGCGQILCSTGRCGSTASRRCGRHRGRRQRAIYETIHIGTRSM